MESKIQKLKERIIKPLEDINVLVDDIEFVNENNYYFLRITLDKVNGLDIDTIVEATNIINPIVDKEDISDESYILDVISKERGNINE